MAYITGLTPLGCSLPVRYLGDGVYECEPDVGDFHRRHRIYNDYHLWYVKVVGKKEETVTVRLNWPAFDPDAVSDEYKAFDHYSADCPPFSAP